VSNIIRALAVLASTLAAQAHAQDAGCSAAVPLDLSGPRPVVTLTTRTGVEARALFDTGAMATVIDVAQAERLGLAREGPLGPPFAGHGEGYSSSIRGMRIGAITLPDGPVSVLPSLLPQFAGVLSPQTFAGSLVRLDLAAATLTICPVSLADSLGAATPYVAGPFALPAIPIVAGGATIAAHIDTGSPMALAFPMRFAATLPLAGPPAPAGRARSHIGEHVLSRARIQGSVRVGPLTLENPEVHFTDAVPGPNVGGALLRRMVIVIDPAGRRSWALAARE
jgi:hypothetical protein